MVQVPPALVPVTVHNCSKGEVQNSPTSCLLCPPATFSFFPNDTQCQSHCPDNADCFGGESTASTCTVLMTFISGTSW